MSIEELSQKLNMSIADINNILNQNATSLGKEVRFRSYFFYYEAVITFLNVVSYVAPPVYLAKENSPI